MPRSVEEWIGKPDQAIPVRIQIRIVKRQGEKCKTCGRAFDEKLKAEMHHDPPLWSERGENRESKIVALCATCHLAWTKVDSRVRAKSNRKLARKVLEKPKSELAKRWARHKEKFKKNWRTGRWEKR